MVAEVVQSDAEPVKPRALGDLASQRLRLIAPLFLLSGGTALLYQVAFGKKLATIFGATAYAVSAVLAAFMGGLALGSHLGGRWGSRVKRPLMIYGVAEVVVGVVCALTPALFEAVATGYVALVASSPNSLGVVSAVRALITSAVVVVPTVAMGLTLPLLARAVASDATGAAGRLASRRRLALLYAINTAGGAVGALLSAYLVLPSLGVYDTMRGAALINVAIGVVAIRIGRREPASASTASDSQPEQEGRVVHAGLLDTLALLSGVLVFAVEVVDTHLLALLIGNSAYAFGLMLAVFLTCLSVGAALAEPLDRRLGPGAVPAALLLTGAALLFSLPIWGQLPGIFLAAGAHVTSWMGREAVRAGAAFLALVIPTTMMGLTFPLLLRRVAGRRDVARRVGRMTAVNTMGSIAGSLTCGYLLLPAAGSQWSLRLIALAFAAAGAMAAWWQQDREARRVPQLALAALAACAFGVVAMPSWDMKQMTNGANVYFDTQSVPDELVFMAEDVHGGWTSVARRGDLLTLYTNGKFQGDTGHEVIAQRSFAHFPSLFVDRHDRALVIGLGTGTTLGTIEAYPYEHIDVAEISPAIVAAAGRYFVGPNRHALEDPRVELVLNDGRNMLLLSRERYDLITIELSSVWFAGAANLYSAEFYQLVHDRLADGGVLQQWVQLHHIRREEVAVVLRTIRHVFEHVALFVSGGQGIVVASQKPLIASRERLRELDQRPAIRETLGVPSLESLLDRLLLSGPELDRFIEDSAASEGPQLSTDENLYLEYATPKGNVMSYYDSITSMIELLTTYRTPDPVARHLR